MAGLVDRPSASADARPSWLCSCPCRSRWPGWRGKIRERVDGPRTALAYGVLTMVAKWANLAGQAGYLRDRAGGGTPG